MDPAAGFFVGPALTGRSGKGRKMGEWLQSLISGFFFGLTVFVIKRDIGRLSAKVDEVAERQQSCRETLFKDFVAGEFCRDRRNESEEKMGNLFGRIKEVEGRTSHLTGLMSVGRRKAQ